MANIVEVGGNTELGDRLPIQSHLSRCRHREPCDLRGMAVGERGLDVGQVTERCCHRCQVGVVDLHRRRGLSLEDSPPRISRRSIGQDLCCIAREHGNDVRIQHLARSTAECFRDGGRVTERSKEHRVGRDAAQSALTARSRLLEARGRRCHSTIHGRHGGRR